MAAKKTPAQKPGSPIAVDPGMLRRAETTSGGNYQRGQAFDTVVDDTGIHYVNPHPRNPPPTRGTTPPPQTPTPEKPPTTEIPKGAEAYLRQILGEYELEELAPWALDLMINGYDITYILAELRNRPEFKAAFPEIDLRRADGRTPLSPADIIGMRRGYDEYMHAAGLTGMFDRKSLYTKWIVGDVSPVEAKARAEEAYDMVMQEPLEVRAEMSRLFGVAAGPAAVAYYLDPTNALPMIQSQMRQAQIGGASIRSMYGLLTAEEAKTLDQLGINSQQAQQGFGELVHNRELFSVLPGEAGDNINRDEQMAAEFKGDELARQRVERSVARRRAQAEGGSRYRVTQRGVGGLGQTTS